MYDEPVFRILGDRGLLVELGDRIDAEINAAVQLLLRGLTESPLEGIIDLAAGYRSLLVVFDPLSASSTDLKKRISAVWADRDRIRLPETRIHEIPVLYGGEGGPDLQWVADYHRMSADEVIALHSDPEYRVYMIGFTPGYPYMGELPERLSTPRRATPRTLVPRGSVGIAQRQTGIYPVASPGGWQIIGWTPVRLFDPQADPPALLEMGDRVRFVAASREEAAQWQNQPF